jgi:hypothetical protein
MIDLIIVHLHHQNHVHFLYLTENQPARQMSDGQASYFLFYRLSTVLASNVTAAILVNALPYNVAPVVIVIA